MKKLITIWFITFFISLFITHQIVFAGLDNDFWDSYKEILKNAVTVNRYTTRDGEFSHSSVDYKKINSGPDLINIISLQKNKLEVGKAPDEVKHKLAFWINAYNFFTIVDVVTNYPVESMKTIGWKKTHHNVGGTLYSLDDIENNILRPLKEPRIHFAINCASVGCPSLSPEIFTAEYIDEQLDKAVINALKNPLHLRQTSDNKAYTTKIFNWFGGDFKTPRYESIAEFIHKFAPERYSKIDEIKTKIKYDWDLNTKHNVLQKMNELGTEFPELELKGE